MYDKIPAVDLALASVLNPGGAVMLDRDRYIPFFRAAETYAHAHEVIVGGGAATNLLLGEPIGPSDFFYELYSTRALVDGRALTDLMHSLDPEGLGHYALLATRIPHKEFDISVDERLLFRIKALEVHRGARVADIIIPSVRPANFARDAQGVPLPLLCMGPEIQLIGTYAALADPSRAGDWPALVRVEAKLRILLEEEIRDKIEEATSVEGGGVPHPQTIEGGAADFIAVLHREYVPRTGHVLIGARGVAALTMSGRPLPHRIQLVSANTFKDEEAAVQRIAARLGFNVQSTQNEPKIPTDTRLRRMSMYILRPGERRTPFLDVYNAGDYQLIAYTPPSVKIGGSRKKHRPREGREKSDLFCPEAYPVGTPFTILRFLLIDAWIMLLLYRMNMTTAQHTHQVVREVFADFFATIEVYLTALDDNDFLAIFSQDYIGRYQDPILHEKRKQCAPKDGQSRGFYPPYYPAAADHRSRSASPT